jgi:hypothetical protein
MKIFNGENKARSSKHENRAGSAKTELVGGHRDLNTAGSARPQLSRGEIHYHQRGTHKKDFAEAQFTHKEHRRKIKHSQVEPSRSSTIERGKMRKT